LRDRLGLNLRNARERLNISQHELAFRAETHVTAISPLELGQKLPRLATFIRLAGALEITPSELTLGILWVPVEAIIVPGSFDVLSNPTLEAKATALREAGARKRKR
jgi:transcriptional regulator with XRE-family HTH domain